jgi:hypothetical protein
MVAMQMTDKNMIDFVIGELESHELHLSTFPAINEKVMILDDYELGRRKPTVSGKRTTGTKDGNLEL